LSRLAEPGCWLKQMKDGGIFMHVPSHEHAYENAEGYRQMQQGKTTAERNEFTLAIKHYKRAMGIFHRVSNDLAVRFTEIDIAQVDWEHGREERKGILS